MLFLFCFDIQNNFGTQHVLQMLRASEKDLPVCYCTSNHYIVIESLTTNLIMHILTTLENVYVGGNNHLVGM